MQDLIKQEQFELEVLDRLQSGRFLDRLVFGGGTMLRLCYGLGRYSVDLDFWLLPATVGKKRGTEGEFVASSLGDDRNKTCPVYTKILQTIRRYEDQFPTLWIR